MHVPDIHTANIRQVSSCCTAIHADLQRRATFPFLFQVTCTRTLAHETHKAGGRFLSAIASKASARSLKYRSQRAVGIADTSIFAPSPQGNLRKLGFSDSFMVCSILFVLHRPCSKLEALSFAKSRQTSSTSFSVGQAPEIVCSHAKMVRECLRRR